MKYVLLAGRFLFSAVFIMSSFGHFSDATIGYAASAGVPMANVLVPLSGVMELIGALLILTGYKAKWGAWLLVIFLIPVTFTLHAFWKTTEPMQQKLEMAAFMKNISMLGAALIISYMGSGSLSIDNLIGRNSAVTRGRRVSTAH
jgi:putative oxidoreductase